MISPNYRWFVLLLGLCWVTTLSTATAQSKRSSIFSISDPGAMDLDGVLPKPVFVLVNADSVIYYQTNMERALGQMVANTKVQLVAMTDTAYKVRGRARHGDVLGWMRKDDIKMPDPALPEKLKAFFARQKQVEELIANKQIALGMTMTEVSASLGKPSRRSSKINADGKLEALEYSVYDRVPQVATGRDPRGNLVQSVVYVKVEVGKLTVSFKDGIVSEIAETRGNPLGSGGVKLVPGPITVF